MYFFSFFCLSVYECFPSSFLCVNCTYQYFDPHCTSCHCIKISVAMLLCSCSCLSSYSNPIVENDKGNSCKWISLLIILMFIHILGLISCSWLCWYFNCMDDINSSHMKLLIFINTNIATDLLVIVSSYILLFVSLFLPRSLQSVSLHFLASPWIFRWCVYLQFVALVGYGWVFIL